MNDQGAQEHETSLIEYLPGEAHKGNRIVEKPYPLKFVEISGEQLKNLVDKLGITIPERLLRQGLTVIGPAENNLHDLIVARALGVYEKIGEAGEVKKIIDSAQYTNAGELIPMFNKNSFVTGVSNTLSSSGGIPFRLINQTPEKKALDQATQKRLNEIYSGTWEFTVE